ncbi:alpha/beta hydrolase [Prochlorococcus sp. MIT 1300]|uniref:esterase/lipase family protein n=1 Tax=Prochlorococcus sp. MIT 1300 TaxID=3096218 RepID=UPI002A75E8E6|nr:alpha/beta hydrolase [Prochlorococcus sp. MIT 1300]
MNRLRRPLVLVHGLWDKPSIFNRFIQELDCPGEKIFAPYLEHKFGRVGLMELANNLNLQICRRWGDETLVDLFGFSMGGLVGRIWLQDFGGASRTHRFLSVGSPHRGTFAAQLVPYAFFPGIAEMKRGSALIRGLNYDFSKLKDVVCHSFYCRFDLMVLPGWEALLPVGSIDLIPVLTHQQLISDRKALRIFSNTLLRS